MRFEICNETSIFQIFTWYSWKSRFSIIYKLKILKTAKRLSRTNDVPWCMVLHHRYIMDFNRWLNHCETKYTQTLLGGSREGHKELVYHIPISMAALMAAFSQKNKNLTFKSKKPPLEPPLIGNYKKCNFHDHIYSDLKGFLNISIIHFYGSIWSSKLLFIRIRITHVLMNYHIGAMSSCFYAKILEIWKKSS